MVMLRGTRWGLFVSFGVVAVLAPASGAEPVGAQGEASPVVCDVGGPLEIGVGVDCTVDLGALDLEPADPDDPLAVGLLDQNGEYWPCDANGESERSELVCAQIASERFDLVTRSFDLEVLTRTEERLFDDVAVIETVVDPQRNLFTLMNSNEPVVFDGRPLPIDLISIADLDGLFVTIRERNGTDVIAAIEVTAPGRDRSVSERLDPDLPPGRYRLWVCVGSTVDTCDELPGGHAFQVIDPEILELVPGHNRPSAQRINMVFAGTNIGTPPDLKRVATDMLTLDGPDVGVYDLRYGPMAIEPLASNRHRFNFWYLSTELGNERSLLFDGFDPQATAGFDLDNMAITVLYGPGYGVSDARPTSLWNQVDVPEADALRFGGARVSVDVDDAPRMATTLAHEWGHSLFELRDEYVGFDGRDVQVGYPNCAPNPGVAESWWGSQDGDIDPFVYEVLRARRAAGFSGEPRDGNLATSVRVGLHGGGCYGPVESANAGASAAYRPSLDSLMSSEVPVFGSVNRARVEAVLRRFSGRGPLADLESIALSCQRERGLVSCEGTLDRYLDPPDRRVALGASTCELLDPLDRTDDGTDGLATIRCSVRSTSGAVELALGSQRRSIAVTDVPEPEPLVVDASEALGDGEVVGEPAGESGSRGRTWALVGVGGLSALALFRVGRSAWKRQT